MGFFSKFMMKIYFKRLIKLCVILLVVFLAFFGFNAYFEGNTGSIKNNLDKYNNSYAYRESEREREILAQSSKKAKENPWVAKFGDNKIFKSEVIEQFHTLFGSQATNNFADLEEIPNDMLKNLIEKMVIQKLIILEARNTDIVNRSRFKLKLENAKNELIQAEFIKDLMENASTDENMKKSYKEYVARLSGKKEYKLSHILTSNQKDAFLAIDELKNGEPFSEIAIKRSIDATKDNGGDLGWIDQDSVPITIENAISKLNKGQFTDPIETGFGYHVVLFEDIRDIQIPSFENAKPILKQQVGKEAVQKYISKIVDKANIIYNF